MSLLITAHMESALPAVKAWWPEAEYNGHDARGHVAPEMFWAAVKKRRRDRAYFARWRHSLLTGTYVH